MNLQQWVDLINSYVWSTPLVLLCLGTGIYFSIRTRFLQVRLIKDMVGQLFQGQASASGVSSFQGFAMALGGRVGTGNIAGVATAIAMGGPGALFWMWMIAFLGAGSAYIESALAQVWKEKIGGIYRGGPSYYIDKGLGQRWYAILFAVVTVISCGMLLPGIQANSIAIAVHSAFPPILPLYSGIFITVLLGLIIFGGVKRIGQAAELMVPFMAVGYILMALVIIAVNIGKLPAVLSLIFSSALGTARRLRRRARLGRRLGGQARHLFQRSGPGHRAAGRRRGRSGPPGPAGAGAGVLGLRRHPLRLLGHRLHAADDRHVQHRRRQGRLPGPAYPRRPRGARSGRRWRSTPWSRAFGGPFVAVALFLFAFTTLMAYAFYAESNVAYLFRKNPEPWIAVTRFFLLAMTFFGTIRTATLAWGLGDIGVGLMAWLNIIAILLLSRVGLATLTDYEAQRKSGQPLSFDPEKLGIRNAGLWKQIRKEQKTGRTTD